MKWRVAMMLGCWLGAAQVAAAATPNSKLPPAPVFPAGSTVDTVQGVAVADPYRALETYTDPAVKAWSDAENARTRTYLDALPHRDGIATRLKTLTAGASARFGSLQASRTRTFALYNDPKAQQPMLVSLAGTLDPKTRKTVLDPIKLDPAGHTEIDWFVASHDGGKVAVSLSHNGSEDGTLHIYDTATGHEIEALPFRTQFPTGGGAVAWAGDDGGYWYTRYPPDSTPEDQRYLNEALYYHRLGEDPAHDKQVLGAADGLPPTGEIFLDSADGDTILASVQLGDGGQWLQYVVKRDGSHQQIATYEDRIIWARIGADGSIYGLSRKEAPMGQVLKLAAPYTGGFAAAKVIIAPEKDASIIQGDEFSNPLTVTRDHLFVTQIAGGPQVLSVYDLDGGHGKALPGPAVASVDDVTAVAGGDVVYHVGTFLTPGGYQRWNAATGRITPTALVETSPAVFADAEVVRAFATSKDGTKVPYTIIEKKGTKRDGHNPVLLYAYGGYGISETPAFGGAFLRLWLDAGGIYVDANLRGGEEYGQAWHDQGRLLTKQNVFDDFDAVGEDLIRTGYTSHAKLALHGGSNGGLLMGATLTQHPELAGAVVSEVGIYDMVRNELDPNGAFNVAEYGSVTDPAQFKALYAYSPYHHVTRAAYPATLFMTGANDGRVNPMHSRKFTAELQAANTADTPILLRTSATSGHGIGSSLDDRIAQRTDLLLFLFDQLDMDSAAAAGK